MLDRLLVFTKSHHERPLGFPDIGLTAFLTGDLVDHFSLPLLENAGLDSHQGHMIFSGSSPVGSEGGGERRG